MFTITVNRTDSEITETITCVYMNVREGNIFMVAYGPPKFEEN